MMADRVKSIIFGGFAIAILAAVFLAFVAIYFAKPAYPRETYPGQYAQSGLSQKQLNWINGARSKAGFACCSTADGYRPDEADIEYDTDKGKYRVRLDGVWNVIEDSQLVNESSGPNPLGRAIAWWYYEHDLNSQPVGARKIRCFAPGAGG